MRNDPSEQVIPAALSAARASVSDTAALLPGATILNMDEQGSYRKSSATFRDPCF